MVAVFFFIMRAVVGARVVEQTREIAEYADFQANHHPSIYVRKAAKVSRVLLPEQTNSYQISGGFIEVSERYFSEHDPDPTQWWTELRLPEVEADYNIRRHIVGREGESAEESIINILDSDNVVVTGEAGSGKSVVCRSVACRWYRSQGIVFYGYGRSGELAGADDIIEMIEGAVNFDDVLIVAEDAARYERREMYDVVNHFENDDRVRFLFDSRTFEWEQFDNKISDIERKRVKSDTFQSVTLDNVEESERKSLIKKISETTDTPASDVVGPHDINPPVEQQTVGIMVQLVYNILLSADSGGKNSMLDADVQRKFNASNPQFTHPLPDNSRLTETAVEPLDNRIFHKIAIGVNILNAMGQPIREPLIHALAPSDEHETARLTIEVLENWMLFEDERDGIYRTFPESWSLIYLSEVIDDRLSNQLFLECIDNFVSVFIDRELREQFQGTAIVKDGGWLEEVDEKQKQLLDVFVIDLFEISTQKPKLGELFDVGEISDLPIPEECSPFAEVQARLYLGNALRHQDRDRAINLLETARELTESKVNSTELARLFELQCNRRLGNIAFHGGDFVSAESYYQNCLRRYDASDPYRERALCRTNLAATLHELGQPIKALEQLRKAGKLCEPLPKNALPALLMYHHFGTTYMTLGEFSNAQYNFELSRDIAYQRQDWNLIAWNENRLANLQTSRGRLSRAEARLDTARNRAKKLGYHEVNAWSENDLATVELKRGKYTEARYHLETATALNETVENIQLSAWIQYQRGIIAIERDDVPTARNHLRESLRQARQYDYTRVQALTRIEFTRTFVKEGDTETAKTHIQKAVDIAHDLHDRQATARATYMAARIHKLDNKKDHAEQLYIEALKRFDALGCAYEVKRIVDVLSTDFDTNKTDFLPQLDTPEDLSEEVKKEIEDALDNRFKNENC